MGNDSKLSRRRIIRGTTGAVSAVALAGVTSWYGTQPVAAAHVDQWTASDTDVVQSDDGELSAVYTEPTVEIEWSNFTAGADSVDVTLNAYLPDTTTNSHVDGSKVDTVFEGTAIVDDTTTGVVSIENVQNNHDGGFDTVNGGVRMTLEQFDITSQGDITESDFTDGSSDTSNQVTEVKLELLTTVNGAQSTNPDAVLSANFVVEVENLDENQTSGGTAGTSAE